MNFEDQISKFSTLLRALLEAPIIAFGDLKPSDLTASPGVYRIFETSAVFPGSIYIGEIENLRGRIYMNHLMGNTDASILKKKLVRSGRYSDAAAVKAYLRHDCSLQFVIVPTEAEKMRLEHFAVAMLGPYFND